MTNQIPKVSIGLPVYNGARYLRVALDAILGQTFGEFEVVISDNGSTDATGEICREYVARDRRIRYYSNEINQGASWNYNRVFELARGKYFRWAPADDVFGPESLKECVDVLDANPDAVLCYPQTILIDGNGSTIRPYSDNLDLRSHSPVDRFQQAWAKIGLVNVHYGLIRSELLRRTSLMANHPGADVMLVLELTLYGKFYEIPKELFYRRMHEAAMSGIKVAEGFQEFYDPRTKGRLFLRAVTDLRDQLVAIHRAPLSLTARIRLVLFTVRCAIHRRDKIMRELWIALRYLVRRR